MNQPGFDPLSPTPDPGTPGPHHAPHHDIPPTGGVHDPHHHGHSPGHPHDPHDPHGHYDHSTPDIPPTPNAPHIPELLTTPVQHPPSMAPKPTSTPISDMSKAWGVAMDFIVTILGGLFVGWGIDRWQNTGPWGTVIGLALGFTIALIRIIRRTLREEAREKAERGRK
ncbi:ATP synthase protein I [Phycisphaerales bacterium]|nr:ATP synthase protein I [Phycisphaerales bacterium]